LFPFYRPVNARYEGLPDE